MIIHCIFDRIMMLSIFVTLVQVVSSHMMTLDNYTQVEAIIKH